MTIGLLVANGCSYTRGAELAEPGRESWPAVLGPLLGVPVVNLACDGGSNRRIVRTTVASLDRICEEHRVTPAETLVMCMWTGTARHECHTRSKDRGNRPDLPDEQRWHRLGRWRIDEGDRASTAYFRHLWDEDGALVNLYTDWLLLDAHLQVSGFHARYCFAWDVLPRHPGPQVSELASRISGTSVYGGRPDSSSESFYGTVSGRYPTGRLYHPLAAGHEFFAGELQRWLHRQALPLPGSDGNGAVVAETGAPS